MARPEVVPLFNGAGWAGYGVEPKRALKLTKRCIERMQAPRPIPPRIVRLPQSTRTRRVARRVARTVGSRGDPSQLDDDPEPEPVARLDGFLAASVRMVQHLERRRAKAAAA
jgi:hypothetical protein